MLRRAAVPTEPVVGACFLDEYPPAVSDITGVVRAAGIAVPDRPQYLIGSAQYDGAVVDRVRVGGEGIDDAVGQDEPRFAHIDHVPSESVAYEQFLPTVRTAAGAAGERAPTGVHRARVNIATVGENV